jgi:hypothetical protein
VAGPGLPDGHSPLPTSEVFPFQESATCRDNFATSKDGSRARVATQKWSRQAGGSLTISIPENGDGSHPALPRPAAHVYGLFVPDVPRNA